MAPGAYAVHIFGGARHLAVAIGVNPGMVSHWCKGRRHVEPRVPEPIPTKHIRTILVVARERGLPVTPDDLIWGRDLPEA